MATKKRARRPLRPKSARIRDVGPPDPPPFVPYPRFTMRPRTVNLSRDTFYDLSSYDCRPAVSWEIWRNEDYGAPRRVAILFDEAVARCCLNRLNGQS